PWELPRLRFVAVGVGIPIPFDPNSKEPVYILEEFLPRPFFKFLSNNSLDVAPRLNATCRKVAEFLRFTQHWEFLMTHGRCIIADHQGTLEILTDPQVITREEAARHWSRGNITTILEQFNELHVCNEWCEFFGI
ncbi:kinase-like protein, partial [Sistotremastrum suecicum HHB10207 ss-3]